MNVSIPVNLSSFTHVIPPGNMVLGLKWKAWSALKVPNSPLPPHINIDGEFSYTRRSKSKMWSNYLKFFTEETYNESWRHGSEFHYAFQFIAGFEKCLGTGISWADRLHKTIWMVSWQLREVQKLKTG